MNASSICPVPGVPCSFLYSRERARLMAGLVRFSMVAILRGGMFMRSGVIRGHSAKSRDAFWWRLLLYGNQNILDNKELSFHPSNQRVLQL